MKKIVLLFSLLLPLIPASLCAAPRPSLVDSQRGWRRGLPARRGNENSARPSRIPRLGSVIRDVERERADNQTNPAFNGCPDGSFNVTFAPDGMSFSVLFDNFVAESGPGAASGKNILRCHLLLPIEVPEGFKIEISRMDYRGFVNIPAQAVGVLRSSFGFLGGRGGNHAVHFTQQFKGPLSDNYVLSSDIINDREALSKCGGSNVLRISNVVQLRNQSATEPAMLTIDSIDGAAEQLVYHVNYIPCR